MDFRDDPISIWLVVDLLWKMMDESSVGMKWHSQLNGESWNSMVPVTTNQLWFVIFLSRLCHCVLIKSPCFSWLILLIFLIHLADTSPDVTLVVSLCWSRNNSLHLSMVNLPQKKHKIAGDDYFMSLPTVKQIHWWWLVYVIFNFDGDGENNKFIGFVFYPSSESCLGITRNSHLLFATMVWLKGQVQDGNRSWPEPNTSIFYCGGAHS